MLLSIGKGIGFYLYIAQVSLERGSRVGLLCINVMNDVMLFSLVMRVYEVSGYVCDLFMVFFVCVGAWEFTYTLHS